MQQLLPTIGIWLGAFFTLAIFSFLYKDNPFYRFAEQVFIGVSAGYWLMYTIYNVLKPNLFDKLAGREQFAENWYLIIPAALGILMLLRLIPSIAWISRFSMAFVVGTTAGITFVNFLSSNVIQQVNATFLSPVAFAADGSISFGGTLNHLILIFGTILGIYYFFFSSKHQGAGKYFARSGILFLMISFGASFGYTVMARISLLIGRLQFLLGDWLHIMN